AVPPLTCRLQLWAGFERLRSDEDLRKYRDPLRGRVDLVAKVGPGGPEESRLPRDGVPGLVSSKTDTAMGRLSRRDPAESDCASADIRPFLLLEEVFLALLSLVDGSRFKRSSSLRVKPAGPLLEDLALSADGPADKAKKETDDSAVKTTASSDKDKESKAEKIAEPASKEQSSADKPSEKSGEETAKKEATSKDKTPVTKQDLQKDAAATKEKPEAAKKEVETAKDEAKEKAKTSEEESEVAKEKADVKSEKADAKKEVETAKDETKEKAETSEKESEVAKEKADAKSEKADTAKEKEEKTDETEEKAPAAVPAAAPAASPAAAPVADKKEKDKTKESADSKSQGTTTSTTLSVYDAPNVQKATTTIGPVDNETLSAYMKECAQQLKAIVKKAESYYTHEQLVIALRQECDLDKEFPTVRKVFFDHRRDCRKFAEDLGAAREAELKGDANAYSECCWTAWHEKSQAVGTPLASALLVLLLAWMM
ncbi:TIC214, partial [Symbiodinium sp. CCMP2456]